MHVDDGDLRANDGTAQKIVSQFCETCAQTLDLIACSACDILQ